VTHTKDLLDHATKHL